VELKLELGASNEVEVLLEEAATVRSLIQEVEL